MIQKTTSIKRSAATGRFVTRSIGRSKAAKFALVEGVTLNGSSRKAATAFKAQGLKGDAYRSAVTGQFASKKR